MTWTIIDLINHVLRGQVRIPAFQRPYVWQPESAALLMDSIYRTYPIGTPLIWETGEKLVGERSLGAFDLPNPENKYPVFYVLDGQQRITALFTAFQSALKPTHLNDWVPIFFDAVAGEGAFDQQFVALTDEEVDPSRHVPLPALLEVSMLMDVMPKIDSSFHRRIQEAANRFQSFHLQTMILPATTPQEEVALIFERINRTGVALDTYQLMTAWTWSTEFDLQASFSDLSDDLDDFGFGAIQEETNLLLKCCGAIVRGDATLRKLIHIPGPELRDSFSKITHGVKGAIEFIRREFSACSLEVLPFPSMIVPLAVFFSDKDKPYMPKAHETRILKQWFWRSCYSRRYSRSTDNHHAADIAGILALKEEKREDCWIDVPKINGSFFTDNVFRITSVNAKTHVLALAQLDPVSYLSGTAVDLDKVLVKANSAEFHHIYPKAFLKGLGVDPGISNSLANISFINARDNKLISAKAPSVYVKDIDGSHISIVMNRHLLPDCTFEDDFGRFIDDRANLLLKLAFTLMNGD